MKARVRVVRATGAASVGEMEEITLAEQVYRVLRKDIIAGDIEAGFPLRLEFLKERYGISFSPLREALNRLQTERLVVSTTSRGFRVAPFSESEMWDAIDARILIDCEALRRSLLHGDDEWEARMVGAFHSLMLATDRHADSLEPVEEQLEERHLSFHQSLIAACGSRWLLDLSEQLYAQTERYRRPSLRDRRRWNVGEEHRLLLDAATARDADRATKLLADHYRETGRMVAQVRKRLEHSPAVVSD